MICGQQPDNRHGAAQARVLSIGVVRKNSGLFTRQSVIFKANECLKKVAGDNNNGICRYKFGAQGFQYPARADITCERQQPVRSVFLKTSASLLTAMINRQSVDWYQIKLI